MWLTLRDCTFFPGHIIFRLTLIIPLHTEKVSSREVVFES